MNNLFGRILTYVLGGFAGIVVCIVLESFHFSLFQNQNSTITMIAYAFIGILLTMGIIEYNNKRALKRNNVIRDETVALITHEMRTSLTSSGWMIGVILKKYGMHLEESDKKMLQGIIDSIHTTVMHSVNLLDVSLLDIKKLTIALEWSKLDKIEDMFKEVIQKYTYGTEEKKIMLEHTIILDGTRMVEVDILRLRIVLENLLENAINYSTGKEKKIIVTITNDANIMHLRVKDTGMGIPKEEQDKIFGEFYRASNARRTLSTGSGIGLYTCFTYIKAHRGTIRFESVEGEGTTFFVDIPLKTVADVKGFIEKI